MIAHCTTGTNCTHPANGRRFSFSIGLKVRTILRVMHFTVPFDHGEFMTAERYDVPSASATDRNARFVKCRLRIRRLQPHLAADVLDDEEKIRCPRHYCAAAHRLRCRGNKVNHLANPLTMYQLAQRTRLRLYRRAIHAVETLPETLVHIRLRGIPHTVGP